MLDRMLHHIKRTNRVSIAVLAKELDISPEMVESMLEQLERLGYLETIQGCATGSCAGCSGQSVCRPMRLWMLGKRLRNSKVGDA